MSDWSAAQYLKFADERTRAARDLLSAIPLGEARRIYDLGCGPGNSTALLAARYPQAKLTGLDTAPDMLAKARLSMPGTAFEEADIGTWTPPDQPDLLFANALFQWVPDHLTVLARLLESLPAGGVLAVQMPDNLDEPSHVAMREVAADGPWADHLRDAAAKRDAIPPARAYYDRLSPLARHVDIWHTHYNHVLESHDAVVEWVRGTGLLPFLAPLDATGRSGFLARYRERIAAAYQPLADGRIMLRYPRLFVVATRA